MNDVYPRSIGARCINRDWFGMPLEEVWEVMEDFLYFAVHAHQIKIHAFVLMSNHFHLLATASRQEVARAMQYFLAGSSRRITKPLGRINHTWRAHYFRSVIDNPRYFLMAYKYFYRNPVEAGLCERVEDYRFSTLHGLLGKSKLIIPVVRDDTLFNDVEGTLEWLNRNPREGHSEIVRKALRRKTFKLPRSS